MWKNKYASVADKYCWLKIIWIWFYLSRISDLANYGAN